MYSSGGGGVTLEHTYAATILSALLANEPITELGDRVTATAVRLQGKDVSAIDDIVVDGRGPTGDEHRTSIGVRRDPGFYRRDNSSKALIGDYLRIVTEHWDKVLSGNWALVLAVGTPSTVVRQLDQLASFARSTPNAESFKQLVERPKATNEPTRTRLGTLEHLVGAAAAELPGTVQMPTAELTWRWLSALKVRVLRLEGVERDDRTAAVAALRRVVDDGMLATADSVFSRIAELSGDWAAQGACISEGMLRRELSTFALKRASSHAKAWALLDRFETRSREAVRPGLKVASRSLELDRTDARSDLAGEMKAVGDQCRALVVTGDPDVGKSALALRVSEGLRRDGASVMSLNLRHLPTTTDELEDRFGGASLAEVFDGAEVRSTRMLLVDGSESVLEGKSELFRELAIAALRAGRGVVAVTRTDGASRVREELTYASEAANQAEKPVGFTVPPLTADERQTLSETFPTLRRLNGEPRARWLLGRPGLVDALLRSGSTVEPADLLCEADVFTAVWNGLIRRHEEHAPGSASPDDREDTAISVGMRALKLPAQIPPGRAAAELRSDGVFPVPENPALSRGDEFATDLFRDFALCKLFIKHGWPSLTEAGAPRWAIRASRLACQALLTAGDRTIVWRGLVSHFDQLAATAGERWAEIPYEALLTLGDAEAAIDELWEMLAADECSGLDTMQRLAQSRYVDATFGDPFALTPVIAVLYHGANTKDRRRLASQSGLGEKIRDLVLAWLRGMALDDRAPDTLRQSIRNDILQSEPKFYDEFAVEALATLGHDIDDQTESWLRRIAIERPWSLHPAVESAAVAMSMAWVRPHLLLELADAYYIERPDPGEHRRGIRDFGDGIRDDHHGDGFGYGVPQAAWYYGPFHRLLAGIPRETISFINRMIDHAAQYRATKQRNYHADSDDPSRGVEIDLPGYGVRRFAGDPQMWAWYRGMGGGSHVCMSALLALERFMDDLFENRPAGASPKAIIDLVLKDCKNLAVPGLVVGFLTRHPDDAGDLLDPFLAEPDVWHLEISRVTGESGWHVRDADADDLAGKSLRRSTPQATVGTMVLKAMEDEDRRKTLERVGDQLVENARYRLQPASDGGEYLAMIEGWAAGFRLENYRASRIEDGYAISVERPAHVDEAMAPRQAEIEATNLLYGLQNRYTFVNASPELWPLETLTEDIATARRIANGDLLVSHPWPEECVVPVAAATVRAHALGLAEIDNTDLLWAADEVMTAAAQPRVGESSYHGTIFPMGADRAAAIAVPLLVLGPFDDLELDSALVERSMRSLASSLFDEVRMAYAKGCEPLWQAPCDVDGRSGMCARHALAWQAAVDSLADCRRGPRDQEEQRRDPELLPPPFAQTLPGIATEELLVDHLRMPIITVAAATDVECTATAAAELSTPLWDAHRRSLDYLWRRGYDHDESVHNDAVARVLIKLTLAGDRSTLEAHLRTFAGNAHALQPTFDAFARVFTYDDQLRESLPQFWTFALRVVLDAIDAGANPRGDRRRWFDWAVAALLPTPTPRSSDPDIDGTLQRCRRNWIQPEALDDLADRWIILAAGEARAADAVVRLARAAPMQWQCTTGLIWLERVIDGKYEEVSNKVSYLWDWLEDLRRSGAVAEPAMSTFHRVVDGLAAGGNRRAVELQKLDE